MLSLSINLEDESNNGGGVLSAPQSLAVDFQAPFIGCFRGVSLETVPKDVGRAIL